MARCRFVKNALGELLRRRNKKNYKFAMMAPLYWSRMSGPYCNCIDIPTVNMREPSFHNIIMSFYDS